MAAPGRSRDRPHDCLGFSSAGGRSPPQFGGTPKVVAERSRLCKLATRSAGLSRRDAGKAVPTCHLKTLVSACGDQERDGAFLLLVGEDLGTRYPGMVIDSDVDEFPACTLTAAIACAASGYAVAYAAETAELLNIEMDDLAWFLALVAWMWLLQLEAREPAEGATFETAGGAGSGDADLGRDVLLGAALTAQVFDGVGYSKRDLAWR